MWLGRDLGRCLPFCQQQKTFTISRRLCTMLCKPTVGIHHHSSVIFINIFLSNPILAKLQISLGLQPWHASLTCKSLYLMGSDLSSVVLQVFVDALSGETEESVAQWSRRVSVQYCWSLALVPSDVTRHYCGAHSRQFGTKMLQIIKEICYYFDKFIRVLFVSFFIIALFDPGFNLLRDEVL